MGATITYGGSEATLADSGSAATLSFGGSAATIALGVLPVDTTAPAVPTGLALVAGDGQLTATWDANSEPDLGQYDLRYSTDEATWTEVLGADRTGEVITGLTNGTPYYVQVRAVDTSSNASAWSASVSETPAASGYAFDAQDGYFGVWFATDGLFADTAGTTPATTTVQRWNEYYANGKYFEQATAGDAPVIGSDGGEESVHFNLDFMTLAQDLSAALIASGEATIYMDVRNASGTQEMFHVGNTGTDFRRDRLEIITVGGGEKGFRMRTPGGGANNVFVLDDGTRTFDRDVIAVRMTGFTTADLNELYRAGTLQDSNDYTKNAALNLYTLTTIGRGGDDAALGESHVFGLAIYTAAHSAAKIAEISTEMANFQA